MKSENIVALCDVDAVRLGVAGQKYPAAKMYRDFREMLDKESGLDAVVISTPDHTHAVAAIRAMERGLHVYCEKPLTRTIHEARRIRDVAKETGAVTQMGTQGHAFEGSRRAVEVIRSGAIGEVTELHVWTDRPAGWWPQGVERPTETPAVPETLAWDLWLGPAPERPYHPIYVPFKWRGFWDFGTGAVGDMGVHNLDTAYWALELGLPTSAEVKSSSGNATSECPPEWSIIESHFPARGARPPVKLTFYDGKKLPPRRAFSRRNDPRQRLAGDRKKGDIVDALVARRAERERHVSPAAAETIHRLQGAGAGASAGVRSSRGMDQLRAKGGQRANRILDMRRSSPKRCSSGCWRCAPGSGSNGMRRRCAPRIVPKRIALFAPKCAPGGEAAQKSPTRQSRNQKEKRRGRRERGGPQRMRGNMGTTSLRQ